LAQAQKMENLFIQDVINESNNPSLAFVPKLGYTNNP